MGLALNYPAALQSRNRHQPTDDIMLEAILSAATGGVGALIPSAVKIFKSWTNHKMELQLMRLQADIQQATGSQRLDEVQLQTDAAALAAAYKHDVAGIKQASTWAVNVRILTRPSLAFLGVGVFIWSVMFSLSTGIVDAQYTLQLTSHVAHSVWWFYFTDRAINKRADDK